MPARRPPSREAQEDEELQYGSDVIPDKPINHAKTLPFHELFTTLFNPLNDNRNHPSAPRMSRAKQGPHGNLSLSPHERRRKIIERFIARWRQQVGNDFYPALRLILPEKDRDRAMYGLKEKAIAKLLVKVLKISPTSDDGHNLLNWKLPGKTSASRTAAGDFAGRCYEVLAKRAMRVQVGDIRIAEVNADLDRLSIASKEEDQLPIFENFYNRMNAEELMWLIRVILRQMKIGASEKTILDIWHPDGEAKFNVTSDLRRVCWDLTDPSIRPDREESGIKPMQCFKPQLAQFQMHSFQKMIQKLGCGTDENPEFWIEEKLDGERMQLHVQRTEDTQQYPGGCKIGFWSRNGKDYTYLYGSSFEDENSSLTRFIKDAFDPDIENIILDGEMITWNPVSNTMVGFGTLKTAALSEKANPFDGTGDRPLFRAFDCLYINDKDLTDYRLKERRDVMERYITDVDKRLEKHKYLATAKVEDIEKELRTVVEQDSEGLVLKNPHSAYRLNSRNDDWIKVKPEYMTEFGESLDCVVIGSYYGQGHRGGGHASFLCGLRADENEIKTGANPMKCYSFFKVGGGFKAADYARIKHMTEGKWHDWDKSKPPTEFIKLGGGDRQFERPDQWIKPCDSVVLEVKAASVGASEQFATKYTLRFPRFKKLREDKTWQDGLSTYEFVNLKEKAEAEKSSKEFEVDTSRKGVKKRKKELVIVGNDTNFATAPYGSPKTKIFEGLNFCVLSEMLHPVKKSKGAVEQIIKDNGGSIFASAAVKNDMICIGEKQVVRVASLIQAGHTNILRPAWILDTIHQAERDGPDRPNFLLPFEPGHMFHTAAEQVDIVATNVDEYGDSYARDVTSDDLRRILDDMIHPKNSAFDASQFLTQLEERERGLGELSSEIFRRCVVRFVSADASTSSSSSSSVSCHDSTNLFIAKNQFLFAGGRCADDDDDAQITHFVIEEPTPAPLQSLKQHISRRGGPMPRIVGLKWLTDSWDERTLLDEESYIP